MKKTKLEILCFDYLSIYNLILISKNITNKDIQLSKCFI